MTSAPRRIALVGFPGVQSLDLVGPLEVFSMANRFGRRRPYEVLLCSWRGGTIECNSGLTLAGALRLDALPGPLDTLLVAGGNEPAIRAACDSQLPGWIARHRPQPRRIGSVCSGAFILAAAGLLDGRRATTHWEFCDRLRAFRPAVTLEPDAIFVADPPFYTSAGITAGIDMCLALVESDCGAEVALAVARNLVLFLRRAGGQTQFSSVLRIQGTTANGRLRNLIARVSAEPRGDWSLPALASLAAMSERTFCRVFKKETGLTPAAFVESARVDRAKALLESSDRALSWIAGRAGFGSLDSLRRAFQKRLGVTPRAYRNRFGCASPG